MNNGVVVKVHCLTHTYPDKTEVTICGLDLLVRAGEKVAILGPNGCGKSTLLKHIIGLLSPKEGSVEVFGLNPAKDFEKIRTRMGVVMQNVDEQIIGPTVYDDVLFGPLNSGVPRKEAERLARSVMDRLKISHLKNKVPHYLSGGEKKKAALAGALVMEPELLILDEPFSNLDPNSEEELVGILTEINRTTATTVITCLHDVWLVESIADMLYLMDLKGALSQKGTPAEILSQNDLLRKYNLLPRFMHIANFRMMNSSEANNLPIDARGAHPEEG
jgi:cobalt/nickel transport system ATP-binding protein